MNNLEKFVYYHVRDLINYFRIERYKKELFQYGLNKSNNNSSNSIVVSMTSFSRRFPTLPLCIKSILNQSYKPDRIILFLDDSVREEELPNELLELQQYGLEIAFRPETIKPHKKYYFAMKENPNSIIITVDDDVIYPPFLFEELIKTHEKFPNCVVAARAHKIVFDEKDEIALYSKWEWCSEETFSPSHIYLATGVGGVLYPANVFDLSTLLDLALIKELALPADDLWLKANEIINHVPVVLCDQKSRKKQIELQNYQEGSLNSVNVHENQNDVVMRKLLAHFKLSKADFVRSMENIHS